MAKHTQGKHGTSTDSQPQGGAASPTPAPRPPRGAKVSVPRGAPVPPPAQPTAAMPPQQPGSPRRMAAPAAQPAAAQPTAVRTVPVMAPAPAPAPQGAAGYVPSYQVNPNPPGSGKRRALKIFGITVASLLGVVALVYFVGVFIFMGRFFPHTSILDMDISGMTPEEVHEMLDGVLGDYTFKVEGHGLNLTLAAKDMGMSLESQAIADNLLSQMNPWAWPYEVFQTHDDTEDLVSTFEEGVLADTIQAAVDEVNSKGEAPKNASLAFDEAADAFKIVPEQEGDTLLADVVLDQVTRGTVNFAPKVTLTDAVLAKPTVTEDDPALAAAREQANDYLEGALTLTMAGKDVLSISAADIAEQVKVADDLSVSFDPAPLVSMVQEKVNVMDTVGATRTYTRPDGKQFTVKGGDYGWITDSQATAEAVKKALEAGKGGTIEITMKQNAAQSPDEFGRDFGNRYIDVDLKKQHAWLYDEDGSVLWESGIVSGLPKDGRDTPEGTYYIKTNDGKSVLRGYKPDGSKDYETEVQYWMPFKDNSIGFHDAGWQEKFGGKRYKTHGSHGCVNLPPDKAKELHEVLKVGDVVVVHK